MYNFYTKNLNKTLLSLREMQDRKDKNKQKSMKIQSTY